MPEATSNLPCLSAIEAPLVTHPTPFPSKRVPPIWQMPPLGLEPLAQGDLHACFILLLFLKALVPFVPSQLVPIFWAIPKLLCSLLSFLKSGFSPIEMSVLVSRHASAYNSQLSF